MDIRSDPSAIAANLGLGRDKTRGITEKLSISNPIYIILEWASGPVAHFPNMSNYGRDLGTMYYKGKGGGAGGGIRARMRPSQWNSESFGSFRVPLTC
jgi:hypothetical protein